MSATSTHIPVIVRKSLGWSIALSVLMIVAGILAIILPPVAGIVATVFFGWLFIFSGVAHFVFAWHARSTGSVIWELLVGVVYAVAGVYLLLNPVAGMVSLTLGLAIFLFAEAFLEFILGFRLRPLPGSGWLLVDGAITLILGVLILRTWPTDSVWVLGTLMGISMMFSGIARLMISLAARRLATDLA
jgi:uncharacterized membrane protein HdeD (DUF308 family)